MKLSLLEGLTENEQEEAKEDFIRAFRFRQNLKRVVEKEIASIVTKMCDETLFENDWAYQQAVKVAEIRAKRKIISLLE